MANLYNTIGVTNYGVNDSNVITELETILPKYVLDNDPTLASRLMGVINKGYIILDKGKLTTPEAQQLITIQFPTVKPGDLITAELINAIMRAVESLDKRITALESGTAGDESVVITELRPAGPIKVLDQLTIVGRNFKFSTGAQRVSFNSIPVNTFKPGSSDTMLIVDVPDIPNLPDAGSSVTLTVSNGGSSATREITVLPLPQPLIGNVVVATGADDGTPVVSPSPIVAGQNADFVYTVTSLANLAAEFKITATLGGRGAPWQNQVQILNSNKAIIEGGMLRLLPSTPTKIFVRIAPVPANSNDLAFTISVNVASGDVKGNSGTREYTVGVAPEPQDETIKLTYSSAEPSSAVKGNTIQLAQNISAHIRLSAVFSFVGNNNYKVSASLVSGAQNWLLRLFTPTPDNVAIPNIGTLPVNVPSAGSPVPQTIDIGMMPQDGASSNGEVEFKIQRVGAEIATMHRMNLKLL